MDNRASVPAESPRIDVEKKSDVQRWAREFGVTPEELCDAVRTVGDEVDKVRDFLAGGGDRVP